MTGPKNQKYFQSEWSWSSKDNEETVAKVFTCGHTKSWFTEYWHKSERLQKFYVQIFLLSGANHQGTRDCKNHWIPKQMHEGNWQNEHEDVLLFPSSSDLWEFHYQLMSFTVKMLRGRLSFANQKLSGEPHNNWFFFIKILDTWHSRKVEKIFGKLYLQVIYAQRKELMQITQVYL